MGKGDVWRILMVFFMTMGIIATIGALLARTSIHQTGVPYLEAYSSPVFAFIGAIISLLLIHKQYEGGKWDFRDVIAIFIVGIAIIMLYMAVPEYLPQAYSVLRWTRTPILP